MLSPYQNLSDQVSKKSYHRLDSTINVCEFETKFNRQSQRQFAQEHKIPTTTLQQAQAEEYFLKWTQCIN